MFILVAYSVLCAFFHESYFANENDINKLHFVYALFNLIGARGTYINLFSTTSVKRSSSGRW